MDPESSIFHFFFSFVNFILLSRLEIFKSFFRSAGYFSHFLGYEVILVIFLVSMSFWSFSKFLGHLVIFFCPRGIMVIF